MTWTKLGALKKSGANPEKYSIFQGFDGVMKSKFYHSMISVLADISHNNLSFPLKDFSTHNGSLALLHHKVPLPKWSCFSFSWVAPNPGWMVAHLQWRKNSSWKMTLSWTSHFTSFLLDSHYCMPDLYKPPTHYDDPRFRLFIFIRLADFKLHLS